MSTRDRDRAQRRQAREDRAAAGRRAGHRRSIAKAAREAEQWEQQDRRRFGGRR
ncbi:hypothetical protein ACGF7W_19630 [Streptomyces sp. NPDC048219]|uniref:hypothetical protein n=1 Tax=Streptomyces sp. NPDC048219 TaxID=3365517 RepID=UPI0037233293